MTTSSKLGYFLSGLAVGAFTCWSWSRLQRPSPIAVPISQPNEFKEILEQFGFPGPEQDLKLRNAYAALYSRVHRHPFWVLEHLTADNLKGDGNRNKSRFKEDQSIPELFRAKLSDYWSSGFDRGHMAPAADAKRNQAAMDETFYLSNICPQVGEGFNRDYWADLEQFCRDLTKKFPDVYVLSGPLYLPSPVPQEKVQGDGTLKFEMKYLLLGRPAPSVSVPTHFFKSILIRHAQDSDRLAVATFVLPNAEIPDETPLETFRVQENFLNRASGMEVWNKLEGKGEDLCTWTTCRLVKRFIKKSSKEG